MELLEHLAAAGEAVLRLPEPFRNCRSAAAWTSGLVPDWVVFQVARRAATALRSSSR
ncbi:hypothetical protein HFP43_35000 [Streptomyces sp. SJ1-7]|nr:hypothetical protein [Streptomyces sp. SJ1-7]